MKFQTPPGLCLPAYLPAIRPTSSRRIGPFFLPIQNINTLTQICCSDLPLHHDESIHPSLLSFLFDWWMKRWEIAEDVLINCTAYTYYVTLMAKWMCTWMHHLLKLLLSIFSPVPKPDSMVSCWDLYVSSWAVIC